MQFLNTFNVDSTNFENGSQIEEIPTLQKYGKISVQVLELDEKDLYPIDFLPIDKFINLKPSSLERIESFLIYKK